MFLRKSLIAVGGVLLAIGMGVSAQETQPQTSLTQEETQRERTERMERRRERLANREERGPREAGERRRGIGHMTGELNLTEEQQQQRRAMIERRLESTKLQREELFKLREKRIAGMLTADDEARARTLHQEIRTAMEGVQDEMGAILTAEQKARLEEIRKQRKERIEQRMRERQERLNRKML